MDKEKLRSLGINDDILDTVLTAVTDEINTSVAEGVKNNSALTTANEKIKELEGKLQTAEQTITQTQEKLTAAEGERDTLSGKLTDTEKNRAAEKLFSGFKFSSELAREAAFAKFKEAGLEFADGSYTGGEDWLKDLKKNNPEAFARDVPPPKLMTGSGGSVDAADGGDAMRSIMGLK